MDNTVEFFFDVGSPASYLAWTQLPEICTSAGAKLEYRPMLLGGVFQATGNVSPVSVPAKGFYYQADFTRFAKRYGVPFGLPPQFPMNTLGLMRGATGFLLREPDRFQSYLKSIFIAMWQKQLDLSVKEVLAETLTAAGFDPESFLEMINEDEVKTALKQTTAEAVRRGVFGAPTCFVGDEMYFGQDRLDFIRQALNADQEIAR